MAYIRTHSASSSISSTSTSSSTSSFDHYSYKNGSETSISKWSSNTDPLPPTFVPLRVRENGSPEPQCLLTRLFTGPEWKALFELRSQLPAILAEAFSGDLRAATRSYRIWGVDLDPTGLKDARASVVLMKFLRACDLDVTAAKDMLVSTIRWREAVNIDDIMRERFPEKIFGGLSYIYGKGRAGHPVCYTVYGAQPDMTKVFADIPRFLRWRIMLMERSIEMLNFTSIDQMIHVHDYAGANNQMKSENAKIASAEAAVIFEAYYPCFTYQKFLVNTSKLTSLMFKGVKAISSNPSFENVIAVGSDEATIRKKLSTHIHHSQLPGKYGGTSSGKF